MVISRRIYKTASLPETQKIIKNEDVLRYVVTEFEKNYYIYIETTNENSNILKSFNEEERLFEIFHFCPSLEKDEWLKKRNNPKSFIMFAKLKPDMISSYIFYHHALQEETRGERRKYYSLFLSGNMLINYEETPVIMHTPAEEGVLSTKISQMDDWNEYMKIHFIPDNPIWKKGTTIADYSVV